jgi:hypothetical protein
MPNPIPALSIVRRLIVTGGSELKPRGDRGGRRSGREPRTFQGGACGRSRLSRGPALDAREDHSKQLVLSILCVSLFADTLVSRVASFLAFFGTLTICLDNLFFIQSFIAAMNVRVQSRHHTAPSPGAPERARFAALIGVASADRANAARRHNPHACQQPL